MITAVSQHMKLWRGGKELEVKEMRGDNRHSGLGINLNDALCQPPMQWSNGDASSSDRGWREVDDKHSEPKLFTMNFELE
jgi:hypothetical protein